MLKNLFKLIFPDLCCGCKNLLLKNEYLLCYKCRHDLPYTYHHKIQHNNTIKKFYGLIPLEFGLSMLYFHHGGIAQELIHNLKYRNQQNIGSLLGELYAKELQNFEPIRSVTEIIPVPLHPKKLKERGYNQVDSFCESIGMHLQIPVNKNLLLRTQYNKTQTQKNREARQQLTQTIFDVNFSAKDENKHFLLVDDVITTGSTLEICAKALLKIPNAKVSILTIAYTQS
jgi:ComF family protein